MKKTKRSELGRKSFSQSRNYLQETVEFIDSQGMITNMIPTTINQKTAVLLHSELVFEHQMFITWNFKAKPSPEERDRRINSHLLFLSRQKNTHIFPIIGVNHSGAHARTLNWSERNPHGHGIVCSEKPIDFQFIEKTWFHGSIECSVFSPELYLTKYASDAFSYLMEKHDYRPMSIICPKHNKRACVPECKWLRRSVMKPSVSPEDASLLRMALNLW